MLLSTLRDYVGKMGGELVLTARFPDSDPVRIAGFGDIAGPQELASRALRPRGAPLITFDTHVRKR